MIVNSNPTYTQQAPAFRGGVELQVITVVFTFLFFTPHFSLLSPTSPVRLDWGPVSLQTKSN